MKRTMHTLAASVFCVLLAQIAFGENIRWSASTAQTLSHGRLEVGVIQPLRYGLSNRVELCSYPIWNVLIPNISAKIAQAKYGELLVASTHSLNMPSPLLRTIARDGVGGILPPDNRIPLLLVTGHHLLLSYPLAQHQFATLRLGVRLAVSHGEKRMDTIDYHLVYTRTAVYHSGRSYDCGLDLNGRLIGRFEYHFDGDLFLLPEMDGDWSVEQSGTIIWRVSQGFSILAGYKWVKGEYPFGVDSQIFPLLDLQWGWNLKKA